MNEELNPCPHCGGPVNQVGPVVVCEACSASTTFSSGKKQPLFKTGAALVEAWNLRAPQEDA